MDKGLRELFKDLNIRLEARFSRTTDSQSYLEWIAANTTLKGLPFSTAGYEFQTEIVNDMHPDLSVIKCSQIGMTEVEIRKALAFVNRHNNVTAIFTLPNEKLFKKVSQSRIKPIIEHDKVFNMEQDKEATRSMASYQFGSSFLFVTNCTEEDATSTPADVIFNDEVDLSPTDILALFNSRLQNSDWKIRHGFSTPSFPQHGIDAKFSASDQRIYMLKCDSCNHWNWPEFNMEFCCVPGLPDHIVDLYEITQEIKDEIDLSASYVRCERCSRPLKGSKREWVARYPNRIDARGYHVTPFSTDRLTLHYMILQLLDYKKRDYLRGFKNTVLGLPHSDATTQIQEDDIKVIMKRGTQMPFPLQSDTAIAVGVDMGQTCHVTIGNPEGNRIYRMESISVKNIVNYVQKLDERHNLVCGACDRLPYTPTSEKIMKVTKGKIVPVQYVNGPQSVDYKCALDYADVFAYIAANRTKMLDNVQRAFRPMESDLALCGWGHQEHVIIEHLRDMVRDEQPEKPAVWKSLNKVDHFMHSIGYYLGAPLFRQLIRELDTEIQCTEIASFAVKAPKLGDTSRLYGSAKRRERLPV